MSVKSVHNISQFPTLPDGASRSAAAPTEGIVITATTNWQSISVSFWNGRPVTLDVQTASVYYALTLTTAVIPITTTAVATPSVVAKRITQAEGHVREVVPGRHFIFRCKRAGAADAKVRIHRS